MLRLSPCTPASSRPEKPARVRAVCLPLRAEELPSLGEGGPLNPGGAPSSPSSIACAVRVQFRLEY